MVKQKYYNEIQSKMTELKDLGRNEKEKREIIGRTTMSRERSSSRLARAGSKGRSKEKKQA